MAKTGEFNKLLASAIDEALNSLGESVRQSTYFHIENDFKLAKDEIPENLFEFQGGLESIFGAGAQYIEILIMKSLHKKIGRNLKIKNKQLEFIEYVDSARDGFMKSPLKNTRWQKITRIFAASHKGFIKQNPISTMNKGADAYVMKPFEVEKLFQTIRDQLKKQEEEKSFSKEKVVEFIETRIKAL